ncbi:MAG: PDZ domain-containing protein [Phycisphaerae bacterium]|nr:PDZ domain-containing protein [Phycisphaerae bacterium]
MLALAGVVMLLALGRGVAAPARPQPPAAGSLAAYAPSDCGLFIQIERPTRINPNLRDVNAWKLLGVLFGAEMADGESSTDWYDVLVANLAGKSASAMRELFSERAALMAPTWKRLADGVIVIQIPNRTVLRHLVGPGMVRTEKREGRLKVYETMRGLRIATDGRTVLIAQRQASSDLFSRCLELLKHRGRDSLLKDPRFAAKVRELPRQRKIPQGFFYFANETGKTPTSAEADGEPEADAAGFWPVLESGVVGMYVQGNLVDFALRASLGHPQERTSPRVHLQWLKQLPRSTLVAWATSLDVDAAFERFLNPGPDAVTAQYATFLAEAIDPERLKRDVVSKIGPRLMLAWGHDFVVEEGGSSLALLVQSTDADGVKDALDVVVSRLVDAINVLNPTDENPLRITTEEIFGTEVTVIELADYFAERAPGSVASYLASTMRLCYASLDDWVLVSWNVNHMRELVNAHNGYRPVLGAFTDVARLKALRRGPTVLGVGQLATAAAVLGEWLDRAERRPDSILNLYARGPVDDPSRQRRLLGLGLAPQTQPGRVEVAKVYQEGPCHNLVEVGDRIVAVNGRVLELTDANGDLRERARELPDGQSVTLRLERAGTLTDVSIVVDRPRNPRQEIVADAVRALRHFQTLSRHLAFATFTVSRSRGDSYQAHFRLRFSGSP